MNPILPISSAKPESNNGNHLTEVKLEPLKLGPEPIKTALQRLSRYHTGEQSTAIREILPSHVSVPIEFDPEIRSQLNSSTLEFIRSLHAQTSTKSEENNEVLTNLQNQDGLNSETSISERQITEEVATETVVGQLLQLLTSDIEVPQTYGEDPESSIATYAKLVAHQNSRIIKLLDSLLRGEIESSFFNQSTTQEKVSSIKLNELPPELFGELLASLGLRTRLNDQVQHEFKKLNPYYETEINKWVEQQNIEDIQKSGIKSEVFKDFNGSVESQKNLVYTITKYHKNRSNSILILNGYKKLADRWSSRLKILDLGRSYFEIPYYPFHEIKSLILQSRTREVMQIFEDSVNNPDLEKTLKEINFQPFQFLLDTERLKRIEHWDTIEKLLSQENKVLTETEKASLKKMLAEKMEQELQLSILGVSNQEGTFYSRQPQDKTRSTRKTNPNLEPLKEPVSITSSISLPSEEQQSTDVDMTFHRAGELQQFIIQLVNERFPEGTTVSHNAEKVIVKEIIEGRLSLVEGTSFLKYFIGENPVLIKEEIKTVIENYITGTVDLLQSMKNSIPNERDSDLQKLNSRIKSLTDAANALNILTSTSERKPSSDQYWDETYTQLKTLEKQINTCQEKIQLLNASQR